MMAARAVVVASAATQAPLAHSAPAAPAVVAIVVVAVAGRGIHVPEVFVARAAAGRAVFAQPVVALAQHVVAASEAGARHAGPRRHLDDVVRRVVRRAVRHRGRRRWQRLRCWLVEDGHGLRRGDGHRPGCGHGEVAGAGSRGLPHDFRARDAPDRLAPAWRAVALHHSVRHDDVFLLPHLDETHGWLAGRLAAVGPGWRKTDHVGRRGGKCFARQARGWQA